MQSLQPNSCNYYPMLASHQPYLERLIEGFNFCLSPQQLPYNAAIRNYMDEELWIPIRVLYKLPVLDFLNISEITIPFVTESLHKYSQETLEVDLYREMVRPKWALQSTVFISNVDQNATTDQIYTLLDDIRLAVSHPINPFEYRNITIVKHSPNAWSIGFNSPSAGAYAAMAMRMKCINGSMVLPMACMHINPPRALYSYAGILVLEVDPVRYGPPFIPNEFVPYYSENPEHIDFLYRKTLAHYLNPGYVVYVSANDPVFWERAYWTDTTHSDERYAAHGAGNYNDSGSGENISKSSRASTHGMNSHRASETSHARQEVPATNRDLSRRGHSSETTASSRDRESVQSARDTRCNSKAHEQDYGWGANGVNRPALPEEQSCGLNGTVKKSSASGYHDEGLEALNGHGASVERGVVSKEKGLYNDNGGLIKFPNPELDKLPSPSFVTKAKNNVIAGKEDSVSEITGVRSENEVFQGSTGRNRDGLRRGGKFGRRDLRRRQSRDGENVGRMLHGRKQQTETDGRWQVISYQKSLQRSA